MADVTPAKRVLPARERRESAAKRLRYSPALPSTAKKAAAASKPATPASEPKPKRKYNKRSSVAQTPTPRDASTPPVEDIIPTKVTSSKPLPATKQKQASSLSQKEYQSIAESAILAASLTRSRSQWLSDTIFKKYWVKPTKRKGVVDQPSNNPDAKSMTKLGNGTLLVEPHRLDVTFYTVREQTQVPIQKPPVLQAPKPPVTSGVAMGPPLSTSSTPTPQQHIVPQVPSGAPATRPEPVAVTPQPALPTQVGKPPTQQTIQTPTPAPKANSDPVIQMLAARAATDPQLKELMKVVATSKATAEQLKEFQKHIDEFNVVVKKQEAEKAAKEKQNSHPTAGTASAQQAPSQSTTPVQPVPSPNTQHAAGAAVTTSAVLNPASPAPSTPGATQPSAFSAPPRPPQYPAFPATRVETIIKHIVLEFHGEGASTDRFLFPEYAALDLRVGGLEMNASFLVQRKGSDIMSTFGDSSPEELAMMTAKWKPDTEYFQPITMTIRANQHRTIETIARAARTLPEVQEHMKKILEGKTRAPVEYLVHQLPREKGVAGSEVPSAEMVDSGVDMGDSEVEDDDLKAFYGND